MNGTPAQLPDTATRSRTPCFLELRQITKSFSGVRVLNQVSLEISGGEVHAITGENGAGKSTLMKVLAGSIQPDVGEIRIHGQLIPPGQPHAALRAGVTMIYQELLPFLDLTVAENIFMGHEPATRLLGWIDRRALRQGTEELLARLGLSLSPDQKMRELRVAEMQGVEIAKALAHRAKVIIMDEPTSAISGREAEALFRIIADLRQAGTSILYISHKLEEVFRLADRVTVLRDGSHVSTQPITELSPDRLISLMVGRELQPVVPTRQTTEAAPILSVSQLEKRGRFRGVSFDVKPGEILGLAGLMGAGRTDVLHAIYGLEPADRGSIFVGGESVRIRNPAEALAAGIALVTEDRKEFGIVPTLGVRANMTLAALREWCRAGVVRQGAERRVAAEQIRAFGIQVRHPDQSVEYLSGGNQQKVVLARALLTSPRVLLLDEPTRGIDIGAKAEVHALITRLTASGSAVVLVSSEMPELFSLSHRILVLRQGEVTAELETRNATPEEVLRYAMPT
jgi:ABC-type sugar transport system ATPase subunit